MSNEDIFKQAVDVLIRLAKSKWGEKPSKNCVWLDKEGTMYSNKDSVPEGVKVYPSEERWYRELKKYIETFIWTTKQS